MNHHPKLGSRSASAPATRVDLSIVVPLHNEELCVGPLLDAIDRVFAQQESDQIWEVVLVDDGSSDATVANALQASEKMQAKVTVLELQRNFGQTAAMQAGLDAASGDLIVTMDGDLQNDPADIPVMVRHLHDKDLDLLVGRRENRKDGLFLRLIPSWRHRQDCNLPRLPKLSQTSLSSFSFHVRRWLINRLHFPRLDRFHCRVATLGE